MLHGIFNFGWSTVIANVAIQPRLQFLINLPWYMYHRASLQIQPTLRQFSSDATALLIDLTEARPLI
jgi:hypothetical protein